MKRFCITLAAVLTAAVLLAACKPDSGSIPASSGQPASSSQPASQPASSQTQSQSASQPDSSQPDSSQPESSSAPSSQPTEQRDWAGTYAREPGSAGQIMLYITQEDSGAFHFKFDAKGLIFEGDAVTAGNVATYSDLDGYGLTFHWGETIRIEQTGTFEGGNVSFDGEFEIAGR